ncbi:MAG TPA: hypothetical protein VEA61_04150 [Allosphingosinicella sp.]|nr:hypothetical protein [Allosphingosinicella sp.]
MALTDYPVARVAAALAALALAACGPARNSNTGRKVKDAVEAGVGAMDEAATAKPGTATTRPNNAEDGRRWEVPEPVKQGAEEAGKEGLEEWNERRRRDASGNSALGNLANP